MTETDSFWFARRYRQLVSLQYVCINGYERGEQSMSSLPRIWVDDGLLDHLFSEAKPCGAECASTCSADVNLTEIDKDCKQLQHTY
jgi:hypothetical protein